mmetsp:Transcript_44190/g.106485  ORF Transcript_44190/g.106485 Transcript_44190/m.106485 type:complete len:310 (+) Transcript_44190:115-1044(+)
MQARLASLLLYLSIQCLLSKANKVDYCDFPGFTSMIATSTECNAQNCLCRLQRNRGRASDTDNFSSIEDGCFRVQSCPELSLSIKEPIKCRIEGKRELGYVQSGFDFNSGTNVGDSSAIQPDTSGSGVVYTFPSGLSAGQEISIRYNAAGKEDLALGFGIGCDGYLYLLADNDKVGKYSCASCSSCQASSGNCKSSCPACSFCTPQGTGFIYTANAFAHVDEINNGRVLEGIAYYENNDSWNCDGGTEYLSCFGQNDETLITAVCAIASVFDDSTTSQTNGGSSSATTTTNGVYSAVSFVGTVVLSLLY